MSKIIVFINLLLSLNLISGDRKVIENYFSILPKEIKAKIMISFIVDKPSDAGKNFLIFGQISQEQRAILGPGAELYKLPLKIDKNLVLQVEIEHTKALLESLSKVLDVPILWVKKYILKFALQKFYENTRHENALEQIIDIIEPFEYRKKQNKLRAQKIAEFSNSQKSLTCNVADEHIKKQIIKNIKQNENYYIFFKISIIVDFLEEDNIDKNLKIDISTSRGTFIDLLNKYEINQYENTDSELLIILPEEKLLNYFRQHFSWIDNENKINIDQNILYVLENRIQDIKVYLRIFKIILQKYRQDRSLSQENKNKVVKIINIAIKKVQSDCQCNNCLELLLQLFNMCNYLKEEHVICVCAQKLLAFPELSNQYKISCYASLLLSNFAKKNYHQVCYFYEKLQQIYGGINLQITLCSAMAYWNINKHEIGANLLCDALKSHTEGEVKKSFIHILSFYKNCLKIFKSANNQEMIELCQQRIEFFEQN